MKIRYKVFSLTVLVFAGAIIWASSYRGSGIGLALFFAGGGTYERNTSCSSGNVCVGIIKYTAPNISGGDPELYIVPIDAIEEEMPFDKPFLKYPEYVRIISVWEHGNSLIIYSTQKPEVNGKMSAHDIEIKVIQNPEFLEMARQMPGQLY